MYVFTGQWRRRAHSRAHVLHTVCGHTGTGTFSICCGRDDMLVVTGKQWYNHRKMPFANGTAQRNIHFLLTMHMTNVAPGDEAPTSEREDPSTGVKVLRFPPESRWSQVRCADARIDTGLYLYSTTKQFLTTYVSGETHTTIRIGVVWGVFLCDLLFIT